VDPRVGLDVSWKKVLPLPEHEPRTASLQPSNYSEYAIPSPTVLIYTGSGPCSPIKSKYVSSDQQQPEDGESSLL
jgi:hypothetical protein